MANPLNEQQIDLLTDKYTNINHKGAFTSSKNFYESLKSDPRFEGITLSQIERFLASITSYALHRENKRSKKYPRVIASYKLYCIAIDLIDLKRYSKSNNKKSYILIAMDLFTKMVWMVPLANKSADCTLKGLKEIYKKIGKFSTKLWCDAGKEFQDARVQNWIKSKGIEPYTGTNPSVGKVSSIERCIKSIKIILFRYFSHTRKKRWYPILSKIARIYNNNFHRVIKCTPLQAWRGDKSRAYVWNNSYMRLKTKRHVKTKNKNTIMSYPRFKYKLTDVVKVVQEKTRFSRATDEIYSRENFRIQERLVKSGILFYKLKDLHNVEVLSIFQQSELVLSSDNPKFEIFEVDKYLKSRKIRGITYKLVLWKGLSRKDASWVKESDLKDII